MEGMAKTSDAARTLRRMEWNDFIRCSPKEVIDKWADEPRSNRAMRRARHGPQRRDRCDRVMPVDGCAFRLERRTPHYQPKLTPTVPLDSPPPATVPPTNTAPLPGIRWA